jgi:hypothetical protein
VDPWLVVVARYVGFDRALMIGLLLLWLFVWCLRKLLREMQKAEAAYATGGFTNPPLGGGAI